MKKRIAAEWEPALGVMLAWPSNLPHAMFQELAKDTHIWWLVPNDVEEADVLMHMDLWGIPSESYEFIRVNGQGASYCWPRDWGPHPLFDERGRFHLLNPSFMFGDPFSGPEDDAPLNIPTADQPLDDADINVLDDEAPRAIGEALGIDVIDMDVAFTGGNVFSDGVNNLISSRILVTENKYKGFSEDEFFARVAELTGMTGYTVTPNFEPFSLQHVDCMMKMLDEERILVARPPKGHALYGLYDHIAYDILGKTLNCYGRPYEILRLDTDYHHNGPTEFGDLATYINAVIINNVIYVPLADIPQDEIALRQWREAMPGYEVKGFYNHIEEEPVQQRALAEHPDAFPMGDGKDAGWLGFDAIHCRTRAVWDPGMIHIDFARIPREVELQESFDLHVRIVNYSGAPLIEEACNLVWRSLGEDSWHNVPLRKTRTHEMYDASLHAASGQTIEYYVVAVDASGRSATRPASAPLGYYSFTVK